MPSSGAINMGQLQTEYGGANPIGMNEYYRGGAYVPNQTSTASVPTSGAIDLTDFYGTGLAVDLDSSYDILSGLSETPVATLNLKRDGTITGVGTVTSFSDTWIDGASGNVGDAYQAYLSYTGDAPTSGDSVNTWIAVNTDRSWTLTATNVDEEKAGTWTLTIRAKGSGVTLDSTTVNISSTWKDV